MTDADTVAAAGSRGQPARTSAVTGAMPPFKPAALELGDHLSQRRASSSGSPARAPSSRVHNDSTDFRAVRNELISLRDRPNGFIRS